MPGIEPRLSICIENIFPIVLLLWLTQVSIFKNVLDLFSFCFSVSLCLSLWLYLSVSVSLARSFLIFGHTQQCSGFSPARLKGPFVVPGMEPGLSVAMNSVPRFREVLDPSCLLARRMLSNTFCSWWCLWGHDLVVKNKERSSRQDSGCHCEEEDKEQKTLVSAGPKHSLGEALDLSGPQ